MPLRKYEVMYILSIDQNDTVTNDIFTADLHQVVEGRNQFFNAGHVIREYQYPLIRIIVTPVDEQDT
jgi:hypothetical protein